MSMPHLSLGVQDLIETVATFRRSSRERCVLRRNWRVGEPFSRAGENGPSQSLAMSLSLIEFRLQAKLVRRMRHSSQATECHKTRSMRLFVRKAVGEHGSTTLSDVATAIGGILA